MQTAKGEATREAILDEALRQASRLGLERLSLAPLAESLSLSKSGLFAHFKTKEELQLRVLEEASDRFRRQVLRSTSKPGGPKERLQALFGRYLDWVRGTRHNGGCLFISVAQEYDDRPGPVRDSLKKSQQDWRAFLQGIVRTGADGGVFRADVDAEQVVFEIIGIALSYQQTLKLLDDSHAKRRAIAAFERLLADLQK